MTKKRKVVERASICEDFQATDDAWHAELVCKFGKDAGDARYFPRGQGVEGSPLRAAYEAREAARVAWEAAR